jgi:hypothetical protein
MGQLVNSKCRMRSGPTEGGRSDQTLVETVLNKLLRLLPRA